MGAIPKSVLKGQMQPADPEARRRALLVVAVAAVVGLGLVGWLSLETARIEALFALDQEAAGRQARNLFLGVTWAAAAVALLAAVVIWRIAMEVRCSGRYPPPGARVLRDTMVRTGEQAARIARVGFVTAGLLAIAAPALVVLGHRLVRALATP